MVRVRFSFGCRHTGKLDNIKKQRKKFPKVLEEVINVSDIILQVLDARFIEETRNLDMEEVVRSAGKKMIYILNKSDLVNTREVAKKLKIRPYIFISCLKRQGSSRLRDLIKRVVRNTELPEKMTRAQVGIVGYPNTGKSSVINFLTGRTVSRTGNEAGFTKGMQKIKLNKDILILDTPGVIPESEYSMDNKDKISKQAKIGAKSIGKLRSPDLVIQALLDEKDSRKALEKFYSAESEGDSEIFLEILGERRGFLKKGGVIDTDRIAREIMRDWQNGVISSS